MSRKLFIKHLQQEVEVVGDDLYIFGEKFEYAWIQGRVKSIEEEVEEIIVDDQTASILVSLENYPNSIAKINVGDYVMVRGSVIIGEHEETGEKVVLIDAKTLSVLTDPTMESLWTYEVNHKIK